MGIKMYSPTLSLEIDDYYNYELGVTWTSKGDTVYVGYLKKEKFVTEKQMLSFILGVYLRYGRNSEGANSLIQLLKRENLVRIDKEFGREVYAIAMPNAQSKAKLCSALLEGLGCDVEFIYRKSIPAGNFVLFNPSQKVRNVIKEAETLSKYIESISTNHVEFTTDGTKFIWKEANKPSF
jgi:hypothetical protein